MTSGAFGLTARQSCGEVGTLPSGLFAVATRSVQIPMNPPWLSNLEPDWWP